MNLINMTPHDINVYAASDCEEITQGNYKSLVLKDGAIPLMILPSSGVVARASQTKQQIGSVEGIPINATVYGKVVGLPELPVENTLFIVSVVTAQAAKDRNDLLIVDSTVRDKEGRIIGCTAFGKI